MEFNYKVTGERRKALVTTISELLDTKAVYKGMPTAAYAIDNLTVTKEGTLIADERTDEATLNKVLAALADAGFTTDAPDAADAEEPTELVISMPPTVITTAALVISSAQTPSRWTVTTTTPRSRRIGSLPMMSCRLFPV